MTSPSFPEVLVPALPSSVIEPLWDQFRELLPDRVDTHPLGCHRPRIPDRVVFDKLVQVFVSGVGYPRIADSTCSATTIRERRDEWIEAGIFDRLEQIALGGLRNGTAASSIGGHPYTSAEPPDLSGDD